MDYKISERDPKQMTPADVCTEYIEIDLMLADSHRWNTSYANKLYDRRHRLSEQIVGDAIEKFKETEK